MPALSRISLRRFATGGVTRSGTASAHARLAPFVAPNHLGEMTTEVLSYHEARAEEELALAETAISPGAVRAHVALADLHLDIVYSDIEMHA
jgi:hypothetical protein